MSSPSVTTALLWTLLSAWSSFAAAFVVVIRNESDSPVIPCVQQANGELEVLDPAGTVPSKGERVYDNASPWLRSDLMKIKEKDERTLSLVFTKQHKVVDCGEIPLENGIVLKAINDTQAAAAPSCQRSSMPLMQETGLYTRPAVADPYQCWSAWVIAPIYDSGGCGVCDEVAATKRYYADGPRNLFSDTNQYGEGTITVQACNNQSGRIEELHFSSARKNKCGTQYINNSVGCESYDAPETLAMQYTGPVTQNLPTGHYSGIVKIRELASDTHDTLDEFYVNVEIEQK